MSYIGQGLPADTFQGFVTDSFTGDGSATTFTLSKEPFSEDTLIVVINNVIQKPTTNFTVSGTTLTIVGTAVASGDVIYAIHMGGPLPIGGAAELDLNGASDKLILDADGDTTISADTDDQIDFKIGGADAMSLGSDLTADVSGEINLDADGGKVRLKDGGTEVARFVLDNGSGDLEIVSSISDKDIKLKGNDGGSNVTAMTIDMSEGGLVRIGGTSHTNSLILNNHELVVGDESSGASGIAMIAPNNENSYVSFFDPDNSGSFRGSINYNHSSDFLRIYVNGSERFRIRDTGSVHIDSAGESSGGGAEAYAAYITNAQASNANGIYNYFDGGAPDSGSVYFMVNQDTSTNRCIIFANGNLGNHDNSYGAISDERIKQDITDVNSQWDDIKNLKVRNFKMKDDVRDYGDKAEKRIGLIAQEAETVSPGLIQLANPSSGDIKSDASFGTLYTSDDEETKGDDPTAKVGDVKEIKEQVKHIKYSVLYMKAIKALQEAMAKIETLETKVKALEDA